MPIFKSAGKPILSIGACGDSPLNPQGSVPTPFSPSEGSVLLYSAAGVGRISPTPPPLGTCCLPVRFVEGISDVAAGSWVFSRVSTCSNRKAR